MGEDLGGGVFSVSWSPGGNYLAVGIIYNVSGRIVVFEVFVRFRVWSGLWLGFGLLWFYMCRPRVCLEVIGGGDVRGVGGRVFSVFLIVVCWAVGVG
ncbi:MAG: hypothetical protein DRN68_08505, partial [Thaumarchaeota archaeon]